MRELPKTLDAARNRLDQLSKERNAAARLIEKGHNQMSAGLAKYHAACEEILAILAAPPKEQP